MIIFIIDEYHQNINLLIKILKGPHHQNYLLNLFIFVADNFSFASVLKIKLDFFISA